MITTCNKHYFSSTIFYSKFTMSTMTTTSIKCATAAQNYRYLEPSSKARYIKRYVIIGDEDSYELGILSPDEELLPAITYIDIVNYLLFTPSPYTSDELQRTTGR